MQNPPSKFFTINPALPLHKNHSFWLAILAPAIAAILLFASSIQSAGSICFSSECQNRFIESNKLPIGVLSLSVLFGVMVGRFHGSAQRIESHKQADENNTFRNFYDHRKLFTEWMSTLHEKQLSKLQYVSIVSTSSLYRSLFEKNSPSTLELNINKTTIEEAYTGIIEEFQVMINHIGTATLPPSTLSDEQAAQQVRQAIKFTNTYMRKYGIEIIEIDDWPNAQLQNHEFAIIAEEISNILQLAFHFSAQTAPIQLIPSDSFKRIANQDGVCAAVYTTLTFERDERRDINS